MSALLFLCVAAGLWNPTPAGRAQAVGAEVREIAFDDVVRAEIPEGAAPSTFRAETLFALPQDGLGQRLLGEIADLPPDTRLFHDPHGNRLAAAAAAIDAQRGLRTRWSVKVELADRVYDVRRDALLPLSAVPPAVAALYLRDGGRHDLAAPELRAVAAAAAAAATDPLDLAFRLNEAVRARLTYDRDGRWDDAATVWRTGRGSCSEYHFLYASLCRIAGLPCRFVGATAWRGEAGDVAYVDTVYHRWSEVFLPGFGWFPVDVSRNDGEDGEPVNTAFGRTSKRLLVLSRGDGGDDDPLGVQYVARSSGRGGPGAAAARLRSERAITWSTPAPPAPPNR